VLDDEDGGCARKAEVDAERDRKGSSARCRSSCAVRMAQTQAGDEDLGGKREKVEGSGQSEGEVE
jgi:hypothetical protein